MSTESFEKFRLIVLQDPALQKRLRDVSDHQSFVDMVASLGEELGHTFTSEDVEAALRTSRREWLEREIR